MNKWNVELRKKSKVKKTGVKTVQQYWEKTRSTEICAEEKLS